MGGVKVAVRVRPFNQREIDREAKLCIDMDGAKTTIENLDDGGSRNFTFDYSFWSHDGFETKDDGLMVPTSSKYNDQKFVFNVLGKEILDNAWEGYHCCLFAYGQTGSGKSYSMIGYGVNKGIVPMACAEIFNRIDDNTDSNVTFEVNFSMLEIYNEKVQDLLIPPNTRPSGGLKVRESKTMGVYVEGLSQHPVDSYDAIEKKTDLGNKNRSIGSTLMNATSSRAHTILTIQFRRKEKVGNRVAEKFSVINLVDLAGSEKAGQTGATGDRLKEGCAINKSLTTLGNVISALADKATGKGKKGAVVPYRDSQLTRILQNALGGNSKTVMICALSPASINYEETLSTLRYADRAKRIQNKATVNESPQDKLIRELKEENAKLKALMGDGGVVAGDGGDDGDDAESQQKMKEMQDELEANMRAMEDMEKSWAQRLEEAKAQEVVAEVKNDETVPHISNLNEDPQLNGKVYYNFQDKEALTVGRKNADPVPDIILGGVGVQDQHATFKKEGSGFTLTAGAGVSGSLFVNGLPVSGTQELKHFDRILLGTASVFIFKNPENTETSSPIETGEVDYEYVLQEKYKIENAEKLARQAEEEKKAKEEEERKMAELNAKIEAEKAAAEAEMLKQKEEFERRLKEMEAQMADDKAKKEAQVEHERQMLELQQKKEEEARKQEEEKRQVEKERVLREQRNKDKARIEELLGTYLPMVSEANLLTQELKRKVVFGGKIINTQPDDPENPSVTSLAIEVINRETGDIYYWEPEKFADRLYLFRDLVDKYFETQELPQVTQEEDPYWDPPTAVLIGKSRLSLQFLGYGFDEAQTMPINGSLADSEKLAIEVTPTDSSFQGEPGEEILVDEPSELIGQTLYFYIKIVGAENVDPKKWVKVSCHYRFYQDGEWTKSNFGSDERDPRFNHVRNITIPNINNAFIQHVEKKCLTFHLIGYPICSSVGGKGIEASNAVVSDPTVKKKTQNLDDSYISNNNNNNTSLNHNNSSSHNANNASTTSVKQNNASNSGNNQVNTSKNVRENDGTAASDNAATGGSGGHVKAANSGGGHNDSGATTNTTAAANTNTNNTTNDNASAPKGKEEKKSGCCSVF